MPCLSRQKSSILPRIEGRVLESVAFIFTRHLADQSCIDQRLTIVLL